MAPARRAGAQLQPLLKTKSGDDAGLSDRLTGRPGVAPEIPQVECAERRSLFGFSELDIRRYRFVYFRYQSIKDVFFHMHTRVHYITVHNYLFLLIYIFTVGKRESNFVALGPGCVRSEHFRIVEEVCQQRPRISMRSIVLACLPIRVQRYK
jgi:hypothetical protein